MGRFLEFSNPPVWFSVQDLGIFPVGHMTPLYRPDVFGYSRSLRKLLTKTPPLETSLTKNCVYCIPCSCGCVYKGKTGRPLKVRLEEHKKAVIRGETNKSGVAEHIWSVKGSHMPNWEETQILDREPHWRVRRLKESAHMLECSNLLSRPSITIDSIWQPIILMDRLSRQTTHRTGQKNNNDHQ